MEKLKGESLIVHTNFVIYVGGIKETLKNEEQKLLLNEIHLNLEQNIIDHEFLECFGDLKSLDHKYFQILITGYEMEHRHFEFYLLMYVRAIQRLIEKFMELSEGTWKFDEVLERFEIVVGKGHILEDRSSMKKKFEKTLENLEKMELADLTKDSYQKILEHFIQRTNKIYIFFRLDKEGKYKEIIREYDCLTK